MKKCLQQAERGWVERIFDQSCTKEWSPRRVHKMMKKFSRVLIENTENMKNQNFFRLHFRAEGAELLGALHLEGKLIIA